MDTNARAVTLEDARRVGDALRMNWLVVTPEAFRGALAAELEHTDVTKGDLLQTGLIALAHLREYPDYYDRLAPMERAAEQYWASRPKPSPTLGGRSWSRRSTVLAAVIVIIIVVAAVLGWRAWVRQQKKQALVNFAIWSAAVQQRQRQRGT